MCGISAIIQPLPGDQSLPQQLLAMTSAVKHRGPDDEGYALVDTAGMVGFFGGGDTPEHSYTADLPYAPTKAQAPATSYRLGLGHRRLSIIDLSTAGHQPMCNEDRSVIVTYNGEIYNYLELRDELEAVGCQFMSDTDTEVVIRAYCTWGIDCLSRFNGMFAFVLVDLNRQRLFAVRDRYGIKPLYLWRSSNGSLTIASEIKQFTTLPGWRASLNAQRGLDFLAFRQMDHTTETMFAGVEQVGAGRYMQVSLDDAQTTTRTHVWYQLTPQRWTGTQGAADREFADLFEDAVRLRLRADVPVGTGLSGGLDSSSIVCTVQKLLADASSDQIQRTFSACSHYEDFDEREYIEAVTANQRLDTHYVFPDPDELLKNLDHVLWHFDEPFNRISAYAEWTIFQEVAARSVKVMLEGHGADEHLAGYHRFFGPLLAGLFLSGRWLSLRREMSALRSTYGYSRRWLTEKTIASAIPPSLRGLARSAAGHRKRVPGWINLARLSAECKVPEVVALDNPPSVLRTSLHQLISSSLPKQLHWADRSSMAHSVEARVPFLDHRLVEFVVGLPDEFKISRGLTKVVLRNALNGLLPEKVRTRLDKMGFVTAEEVWITNERSEMFSRAIRQAVDQSKGVLNQNALTVADGMINGKLKYDSYVWRMICFAAWINRFSVEV